MFLQNRISEVFSADIHPAAAIGKGILVDHGNSVVIGETSVVEDNVSILHEVTLGGTGKDSGDRHPKVRQGVLIGAGAKVLGNVEIGAGTRLEPGVSIAVGARVGADSWIGAHAHLAPGVVLEENSRVPPGTILDVSGG